MKSKIFTKQILVLVVVFGVVIFLILILKFISKNRAQYLSLQEKENSLLSVSVDMPVRLKIPEINIDASIEYVGLTPDGAMDVPKDPNGVAWYKLGPRPGQKGNAVIDGHSGYKDNRPAVFDNLYKLVKGDKLHVEDGKGVDTTFVIREVRKYDPKADAKNVFNSNDGKSHLNLITCTGAWDDIRKSHTERLVIFSDKEI